MLSRSVLPLARARPVPSTLRSYPRWYAQNNKPRTPYVLPNQKPKPAQPNPARSQSNTSTTNNQSTQPKTKPTVVGASSGAKATESVPPDAASSKTEPKKPLSEPDVAPEQPEFDTAAQPEKPQKPLPDLTQGIPSTLGAELEAARKGRKTTALNLTEDPSQHDYEEEDGGGGRSSDAYESSLDRRRARVANVMYGILLGGLIGGTVYMGRNWDSEEEAQAHKDAPSGWGLGLFYNRIKARLDNLTSYYRDPAFEKLLPDEDPSLRQPYTLVLSLEDLLVHSEWTREHGWRVAKRPGVDYFLRYLNQYYELVLFTSVPSMMADQVLRKLDPFRIIRWPLFREATKYKDGEYVKDLSYLNRDLSKVILIDTVPAHAREQPENAIILPKWKGDPKDKSLVALIPFLEYVAGMNVEDVRPVIKSFEGTYIPAEFAVREKVMREKFQKQMEEEQKSRPRRGVGNLAALLGLKPQSSIDGQAAGSEEKMLWDQIRERGQKNYEMMEQEIRENGETWLKMMAEEEEKARQEQMKNMKGSFTSFFGATGGEKK
ncbi:mitochondrial translocase complex component (Tim50), putative [Talaromyces stipitatus ATCC 10500]|uniref:Mitochondrial import inner membrane translocase subunit TIM50 n=1 Tax=Talaromyces stipitatus (strain ATCC 10500 / CBS 375.48 / QM 6759 / NRRL 1006) TaxID=441959 RepID=B8M8B0_TALSN|nr:mitochondrial translocase complex component (Tim50), putative [Talaromyces stipitatus ATCC 10500]EED20423.1 mitochondrial translocase complex component (Tim50), putative [Talaromyces stipitatus ATCC 10500]